MVPSRHHPFPPDTPAAVPPTPDSAAPTSRRTASIRRTDGLPRKSGAVWIRSPRRRLVARLRPAFRLPTPMSCCFTHQVPHHCAGGDLLDHRLQHSEVSHAYRFRQRQRRRHIECDAAAGGRPRVGSTEGATCKVRTLSKCGRRRRLETASHEAFLAQHRI